jgi:hypothetical protein
MKTLEGEDKSPQVLILRGLVENSGIHAEIDIIVLV